MTSTTLSTRNLLQTRRSEFRPHRADFSIGTQARPSFKEGTQSARHSLAWFGDAISATNVRTPAELVPVVRGVSELINAGSIKLLDELLDHIRQHPSRVDTSVLVSLLRSSAPVRGQLVHWRGLVATAREVLSDRQLDVGRILNGL
jgi:hypothetical protein